MKSSSSRSMTPPPSIPESSPARTNSRDDVMVSPSIADQVSVGTSKILDSPHVSEGPGRIASAPVPSVFRDDRGEIHRLRVGGKRINLTHSRSKVMRSGYIHPTEMKHFVVSGRVELWKLTDAQTDKVVYDASQYFSVPAYTPHILHFLQDTILMEWWEGEFRCFYYHPYRHVMDIQNSIVCTSTGQMMRLVPQDYMVTEGDEMNDMLRRVLWWTTGLAMGVIAGIFVGRSKQ